MMLMLLHFIILDFALSALRLNLYIMILPKFTLKYVPIGSGNIIGKDNIGEFFNYVSKHKKFEDISLAELAPNYETAAASLVHMLEARFVNLNPIIQQMFLNLDNIKDIEKREFIL